MQCSHPSILSAFSMAIARKSVRRMRFINAIWVFRFILYFILKGSKKVVHKSITLQHPLPFRVPSYRASVSESKIQLFC